MHRSGTWSLYMAAPVALNTGRPWRARDLLQLLDALRAGGELHDPRPARAHRPHQRVEFGQLRDRRGHRHAAVAGVIGRVRSAEPYRSAVHRLGHQRLHPRELLRGRLGPFGRRLAHHRGADHGVAGEHRDVRARSDGAQRGHVLPEGLELPAHPRAERVEVHAFDHGEVAQDEVAHGRRGGSDTEPAVAHYRRRHSERWRWRQRPVPGDLRVVVGVQIDDSGCECEAAGVDLALRLFADRTDGTDASVADRDIGPDRVVAETVDDGRTADDELIHCRLSRGRSSAARRQSMAVLVNRKVRVRFDTDATAGIGVELYREARPDAALLLGRARQQGSTVNTRDHGARDSAARVHR